jgi:hypothetical protein
MNIQTRRVVNSDENWMELGPAPPLYTIIGPLMTKWQAAGKKRSCVDIMSFVKPPNNVLIHLDHCRSSKCPLLSEISHALHAEGYSTRHSDNIIHHAKESWMIGVALHEFSFKILHSGRSRSRQRGS